MSNNVYQLVKVSLFVYCINSGGKNNASHAFQTVHFKSALKFARLVIRISQVMRDIIVGWREVPE